MEVNNNNRTKVALINKIVKIIRADISNAEVA